MTSFLSQVLEYLSNPEDMVRHDEREQVSSTAAAETLEEILFYKTCVEHLGAVGIA